MARRAIKDVYRASEEMDDSEFQDAAELVGILGRMMKRKSFEGTPRVGMTSPEPAAQENAPAVASDRAQSSKAPVAAAQQSPQSTRRAAAGPPIAVPAAQAQMRDAVRSRSDSTSKSAPRQKERNSHEGTPKSSTQRHAGGTSQDTTPRARHIRVESGASTTPRAPQGVSGRSTATPSTVRSAHRASGSGGSAKGTPSARNPAPILPSAAATLASENVRYSPTLRHSPPLRRSPDLRRSPPTRSPPTQESPYSRQQR